MAYTTGPFGPISMLGAVVRSWPIRTGEHTMFCIYSNWLSSPTAFGITLVSGLLLIAAVLVLSGHRRRQPHAECPDPECGHRNPPNARYCARCGRELNAP